MAVDVRATTFVTGAAGFIGTELVTVLTARPAPLFVGPIHHNHLQANAVFSNIRLRGIGFRFRHPTLEQGLQEVLGALHE